jgi:type II secretory pathway component GspD/PulD (secretin)
MMKWNRNLAVSTQLFALCTLALTLFVCSANAQTQVADSRPVELKASPETYQTLYLTSLTQQRDANDIVTDLRNMFPRARLYYVSAQNAVSMRGTPDDIVLAQKILSDIDRTKKIYRLTYTITETDGGKPVQTQHFAFLVASGERSTFKQGSRVPVVTGEFGDKTVSPNSQVQYLDVGLNVEASLGSYSDGLKLETKIEQSNIADEKSGVGSQDPIVRQTVLETTAALRPDKPLIVGSLDIPGSTRHRQVEVVSELVQ